MAIYSRFTHWKWWFSIVLLVYQRVNTPDKNPKMSTRKWPVSRHLSAAPWTRPAPWTQPPSRCRSRRESCGDIGWRIGWSRVATSRGPSSLPSPARSTTGDSCLNQNPMMGASWPLKKQIQAVNLKYPWGPKPDAQVLASGSCGFFHPCFFGIYRDIQPTNIEFIHSWTPQQSPQLESRSTCRSDRRGKLSPPQQFRSEEIWQRIAGKISKGRSCSPFNSSPQNNNLPNIEIQHDSTCNSSIFSNPKKRSV